MKTIAGILAAATLVVSVQANAVLRKPGTFVPTQCGAQEAVNADAVTNIVAVCVGSISVEASNAVEFRMKDGSSRLFRVAQKQNLLMALRSGNVKSNLRLVGQNGEETTMKVIETKSGEVAAVSGELDGEQYLVTDFHSIFSIQEDIR